MQQLYEATLCSSSLHAVSHSTRLIIGNQPICNNKKLHKEASTSHKSATQRMVSNDDSTGGHNGVDQITL